MKNFLKSGFMAASAKGGPIPPPQERSLLAMKVDAVLDTPRRLDRGHASLLQKQRTSAKVFRPAFVGARLARDDGLENAIAPQARR
ncbi:hypothetical protein M5C90_30935 [Pseudomonas chlororaphis subsp. piscium]|nr:hypothetical protein M5C90_30935 [Pseudomonas chlororaphis subsp. piscium]